MFVLLLLSLTACRGGDRAGAVPTTAPTVAPVPSPRPDETPAATPAVAFPAPPVGEYAGGDPTLPTRTPTAEAALAAGVLPTPACAALTPARVESDYLANTPERTSLFEAGMAGERFVLTGYVLDANCAPIPGAWLDFWQADADGRYDAAGYRLRGHQFAGADGRYRLETIVPGYAPGRTRTLHVRVMAPGGPLLSTQLFFSGEPDNAHDDRFLRELLITNTPTTGSRTGAFDFVIPLH